MIWDKVFVLGLLGLSAVAPYWGLCVLLSGLVWGDKAGAKTQILISGFPLYISEAFLLGFALHFLWTSFARKSEDKFSFKSIPAYRSWLGFYAAGLVSGLRGLLVYPVIHVLRDAALIYYSAFTHITPRLIRTEARLKKLAFLIGGIVVLKTFTVFLSSDLGFNFDFVNFQPAAISLAMGCLLIISLFTAPFWVSRRPWLLVAVVFVTMIFMDYCVRSSWLGLIAVIPFYIYALVRYRLNWIYAPLMVAAITLGIVASVYAPNMEGFAKRFKNHDVTIHENLAPLPAPFPEKEALNETLGTAPSVHEAQESSPVLEEMKTLRMGLRSPNVLTRLLFWVEIVEEVFSVRLPVFQAFVRDPFHMQEDHRIFMEHQLGYFILDSEIKSPFQRFLATSPALRLLNGVPLGKYFIPRRIFWWFWDTTRYDPHNSHLAILYRTGVIGFIFYMTILVVFFKRGLLQVSRLSNEEARLYLLAVMACVIFYFIHAMTDVTFENPYKGIPFWVLLGLMEAIPKIYQPSPPTVR